MNEQDDKAFEEWFENHLSISSSLSVHCYEAWQAACEYKEKEVSELKDNIINELQIIIRADNINTNWENKEFQEAVHYNWLDDENHRITQENFNLQIQNKKLLDLVLKLKQIHKWDSEISKMIIEVLEEVGE